MGFMAETALSSSSDLLYTGSKALRCQGSSCGLLFEPGVRGGGFDVRLFIEAIEQPLPRSGSGVPRFLGWFVVEDEGVERDGNGH
jgi:hypothetical protein